MELTGKLIVKGDTQSFGANGFRKREFVITFADNPEYPQFRKIELTQDKCDLLDQFNINDFIKVKINAGGRKWTNPKGEEVYFNSDTAWFIERHQPGDISPERDQVENTVSDPEWINKAGDACDLPF